MEKLFNETAHSLLYKYRDWDNQLHRTIITDQTIWFPSCKKLNDPDDCKTPIFVREITREKKKQIRKSIHERVSIDFPSLSRKVRKKMEKELYEEKNFMNYHLQKKLQSDTINKNLGYFHFPHIHKYPKCG